MKVSTASRAAPVAAALAALLAGCSSTTYGTGEAPELAMFREVSGGFGGDKKAAIDYQPRAPLVLPPKAELRPPVESAETAAAAWPDDPDKRVAASRYGDPNDNNSRDDLTPEEVARLKPLAALSRDRRADDTDENEKSTLALIRDRDAGKKFEAALAEAEGTGTGERRYLTDPPEEYRQPAATAPTEFEEIKKKKKSGNFFSRLFGAR